MRHLRHVQKSILIVNRALTNHQKIRVIARELSSFDLEGIFIVPALRRIIDSHQELTSDQGRTEMLGELNEGNGTS